MLQLVNSFLSPSVQDRKTRSNAPPPGDDDLIVVSCKEDEVTAMGPGDSPCSSLVREFPLKVRCRTDLQKIPVVSVRPFDPDGGRCRLQNSVTSVWLSFSRRP